jgi:hypothetical protein
VNLFLLYKFTQATANPEWLPQQIHQSALTLSANPSLSCPSSPTNPPRSPNASRLQQELRSEWGQRHSELEEEEELELLVLEGSEVLEGGGVLVLLGAGAGTGRRGCWLGVVVVLGSSSLP